ncbi:MAG: LPP20 family lipoprotein [Spirochaetaceae bacterium]|nr:LPP20 family lipoprotein [Spirochaetaceae bacterium]
MKKLCMAWLALAVLAVFGCKSKPESYENDPRSKIIGAEGIPRPEWMNKTPKSDDIYYVVGDGRDATTDTVKRNLARADALAKLSQWKSAVVADTMKNYIEEGGTIGNTQTLMRFEQATVTRSTANVSGFDQEEYWVDQAGVYHILYSYPKDNLAGDFKTTVSEFQRNEAAAFAEFKADEAFRYLEAQLDKHE